MIEYFPDWIEKYPIFDESHRDDLNTLITDEYWTREIGYETPARFIKAFNTRMKLIMPKYNQLYTTMGQASFNPLVNYSLNLTGKVLNLRDAKSVMNLMANHDTNFIEAMKSVANGEVANTSDATINTATTSETTTEAKSRSANSAFPQTMLASDGDYATSAADGVSSSTGTGNTGEKRTAHDTGSSTTSDTGKVDTTRQNRGTESRDVTDATRTEDTTNRTTVTEGRMGDPGKLLASWLDVARSVDQMVVDDLSPLFMSVYDSGHEYVGRPHFPYLTGWGRPFAPLGYYF